MPVREVAATRRTQAAASAVDAATAEHRAARPPQPLRVAVIGCGYWGPNLLRNFHSFDGTCVAAACDADPGRLRRVGVICPGVHTTTSFEEVLECDDVDAVAIATPVRTHARLARAALEAGKHVLVEKPLADSVADAEKLTRLADERNLVLMVDHTFVYSQPVQRIKQLIDSGELGRIYYIDSVRINLGLIQNDINVLWDLAPHDLSIVDYLLGRTPHSVSAIGSCHTGSGLEDVAYLNLDFGDELIASFHVNWLSPVKIRHMIIGGSRKSLVYDHLNPVEPIKVYDRGVSVSDSPEARHGLLISYRTGDVWSPHVEQTEPLASVVRHFAECVREGRAPLSDGRAGLRIARVLEAAAGSMQAQGVRISLSGNQP
jgi:predicted dehydrogenase